MIFHTSPPSVLYPCIVQINFSNGDIAFYKAKNISVGVYTFADAQKSYLGKIVAIFKPKK